MAVKRRRAKRSFKRRSRPRGIKVGSGKERIGQERLSGCAGECDVPPAFESSASANVVISSKLLRVQNSDV